jgi:hypothetical protein
MDYLRADYKRWINADSWTVERAILLLLNAETLPKQNDNYDCGSPMTIREQSVYNQFMEIWPILESSLKYGSLKKLDKGCVGLWNDVRPKDFIYWAQLKGYAIPEELIGICTVIHTNAVEDVGKGNHLRTETKPEVLSKLEKQQKAILKVIETKQFKPMAIPDNEKGAIKSICESDDSVLFEVETAFDRAWKKGIGKLWQMEHHNSYAHRGNNW